MPTEEEGAAEEATAGTGESGDQPSPARTAPQSAAARPPATRDDEDADSTPMTHPERRNVAEFPLYARTLEFCAPELDSFIRVTAMNVCMNIIRLATVGYDDDEDEDDKDDDEDCSSNGNSQSDNDGSKARTELPTSTPSGALHEAPPLPLRDRIAIARFACHPERVSDLVSPLCARLTGKFGKVEGAVRALEELADGAAAEETPPGKKASPSSSKSSSSNEKKEGEWKQLRDSIQNLIASMQDELLLLYDLLRVGLISLNEQAIEMMLASFVYPMLLQLAAVVAATASLRLV